MYKLCLLFTSLLFATDIVPAAGQNPEENGYILEHEANLADQQPGPHDGGGFTTAYSYFKNVKGLNMVFRKRILHKGSGIGYHLQENDEIYYILSGTGIMKMNGRSFPVKAGDAVLTRPGSYHGLKPSGKEDLVIFIVYENK